MLATRLGFPQSLLALARVGVCVAAAACGEDSSDDASGTNGDGAVFDPSVMTTTPDASISTSTADAGSTLPPGNTAGDTFFRTATLKLLAPNMVAKPFGGEIDSTADAQKALDGSMTLDEDKDGKVDLSLLIRFLNGNPKGMSGQTTTGGGICPFPVSESAACTADPAFPFQAPPLQYVNGSNCQLENTKEVAPGACFITTRAPLAMVLPLIGRVPLEDGQVIGTWQGTEIVNGFVRGFLPKSVAQQTKLPDPVPDYLARLTIKGGTPLTDFLSDTKLEDNKGVMGWWFLMSFTAKPAKFK